MSDGTLPPIIPLTDEEYYEYLTTSATLQRNRENIDKLTEPMIELFAGLPGKVEGPFDTVINVMNKIPGAWLYYLICSVIIVIYLGIIALINWRLSVRIKRIKTRYRELKMIDRKNTEPSA